MSCSRCYWRARLSLTCSICFVLTIPGSGRCHHSRVFALALIWFLKLSLRSGEIYDFIIVLPFRAGYPVYLILQTTLYGVLQGASMVRVLWLTFEFEFVVPAGRPIAHISGDWLA